jgi:hypothetical protein
VVRLNLVNHEPDGVLIGGPAVDMGYDTVVDLSAEGTLDWVRWQGAGEFYVTSRMAVGKPLIKEEFEMFGIGRKGGFSDYDKHVYPAYRWTNGTPPNVTGKNKGGINRYNRGEQAYTSGGFRITVAADTTPRMLTIYAGSYNCTNEFKAVLSDGLPFFAALSFPQRNHFCDARTALPGLLLERLAVCAGPAQSNFNVELRSESGLCEQGEICCGGSVRIGHLNMVGFVPGHHLVTRYPVGHCVHDRPLRTGLAPAPLRFLPRQLYHLGTAEIHLEPPLLKKDSAPDNFARFGNASQRATTEAEVHRGLTMRVAAGPSADVMCRRRAPRDEENPNVFIGRP